MDSTEDSAVEGLGIEGFLASDFLTVALGIEDLEIEDSLAEDSGLAAVVLEVVARLGFQVQYLRLSTLLLTFRKIADVSGGVFICPDLKFGWAALCMEQIFRISRPAQYG